MTSATSSRSQCNSVGCRCVIRSSRAVCDGLGNIAPCFVTGWFVCQHYFITCTTVSSARPFVFTAQPNYDTRRCGGRGVAGREGVGERGGCRRAGWGWGRGAE